MFLWIWKGNIGLELVRNMIKTLEDPLLYQQTAFKKLD